MIGLFRRFAAVFAVLLSAGPMAYAAQPYDQRAFDEAQSAGKTVLIDVTAPWCPTCRQQQPTIEAIEKERPDLLVFAVDFDSAKDLLRHLRVRAQSTLIVFRGRNEVARATGETDPGRLRALVAKGF